MLIYVCYYQVCIKIVLKWSYRGKENIASDINIYYSDPYCMVGIRTGAAAAQAQVSKKLTHNRHRGGGYSQPYASLQKLSS